MPPVPEPLARRPINNVIQNAALLMVIARLRYCRAARNRASSAGRWELTPHGDGAPIEHLPGAMVLACAPQTAHDPSAEPALSVAEGVGMTEAECCICGVFAGRHTSGRAICAHRRPLWLRRYGQNDQAEQ
jgi:hypothetical protein